MSALLKDKTEIVAWLNKYDIKNSTLIEDPEYGFIVDVAGDVDLKHKKLTSIPVKFNVVSGSFSCSYNMLKTLEGAPKFVGEHFFCGNNNRLTSLLGAPSLVGRNFYCYNNRLLTTLEYCLTSVGESFWCSNNQLKNLKYYPSSVGENFYCDGNPLLGPYQEITDFRELKNKLISDKEKSLLSASLNSGKKSILHKL